MLECLAWPFGLSAFESVLLRDWRESLGPEGVLEVLARPLAELCGKARADGAAKPCEETPRADKEWECECPLLREAERESRFEKNDRLFGPADTDDARVEREGYTFCIS